MMCRYCGNRWQTDQAPSVRQLAGWIAAEHLCPRCHQPGWQQRLDGLPYCLAELEDGLLCGEPTTTMDMFRDIMVCPEHAPNLL